MITFDEILMIVREVLTPHADLIERMQPIIVNRDLNGRVRLIVSADFDKVSRESVVLGTISQELAERLTPHAFPHEQMILYEDDVSAVLSEAPCFPLEGLTGAIVADRLATAGRWASISPVVEGAPRVVFFFDQRWRRALYGYGGVRLVTGTVR